MPTCLKCNNSFKTYVRINNEPKILSGRKYCLTCSPYKQRNTRQIHRFETNTLGKTCTKCNKLKPFSDFCRRTDNKRFSSWCTYCQHYYHNDNIKRLELKKKMVDYLGGSCKNCGYKRCLQALEFHHTDPTTKSFTLSNIRLLSMDWDIIRTELDKCVLLCANCHREEEARIIDVTRQHERLQSVS